MQLLTVPSLKRSKMSDPELHPYDSQETRQSFVRSLFTDELIQFASSVISSAEGCSEHPRVSLWILFPRFVHSAVSFVAQNCSSKAQVTRFSSVELRQLLLSGWSENGSRSASQTWQRERGRRSLLLQSESAHVWRHKSEFSSISWHLSTFENDEHPRFTPVFSSSVFSSLISKPVAEKQAWFAQFGQFFEAPPDSQSFPEQVKQEISSPELPESWRAIVDNIVFLLHSYWYSSRASQKLVQERQCSPVCEETTSSRQNDSLCSSLPCGTSRQVRCTVSVCLPSGAQWVIAVDSQTGSIAPIRTGHLTQSTRLSSF